MSLRLFGLSPEVKEKQLRTKLQQAVEALEPDDIQSIGTITDNPRIIHLAELLDDFHDVTNGSVQVASVLEDIALRSYMIGKREGKEPSRL